MKLKWYGHSCFGMTFSDGTVVITDPFDPPTGYPLCTARADIVTLSHRHHDHDYTESLTGNFTVLDGSEPRSFGKLRFSFVDCFHDKEKGALRGRNRITVIEGDGLKIVHLGDLGHLLDEAQREPLKGADLLLVPIGGYYTIDTDEAVALLDALQPKSAVAMHFANEYCHFNISDEKRFVTLTDAASVPGEIELTKDIRLPKAMVMRYEP